MTDQTKFTILIPTRERADTLYYALRTLTQQRYENLEIVVSDNASTDRTAEVVREASDSRVRYVNTGSRVSMSHNFEFALSHVRDGWIGFIGDDDGLLPGALERVDAVVQETGCTAVTTGWCYYRWPRIGELVGTTAAPLLSVPVGKGYEVRDSRRSLKRLLNGEEPYQELPRLYTGGFAALELVRRALDKEGRFFRSRIPDVYSAVALAAVSRQYVAMRAPVAVAGVSVHSTGDSQMTGSVRTPGERFEREENLPWHPRLGGPCPVFSMSLLVYESYLQAQDLHGDVLKVSMADQLGQALKRHTGNGRTELEDYVSSAAERNGLDIRHVRESATKRRIALSLKRHKNLLPWLFSRRLIDDAYGARNVLEASWIANAVYEERMEGPFWRAKEVAQRLRTRFGRSIGGVTRRVGR